MNTLRIQMKGLVKPDKVIVNGYEFVPLVIGHTPHAVPVHPRNTFELLRQSLPNWVFEQNPQHDVICCYPPEGPNAARWAELETYCPITAVCGPYYTVHSEICPRIPDAMWQELMHDTVKLLGNEAHGEFQNVIQYKRMCVGTCNGPIDADFMDEGGDQCVTSDRYCGPLDAQHLADWIKKTYDQNIAEEVRPRPV